MDDSGASGVLVEDKVRIGSLESSVVFGAVLQERGKFEEFQEINGILGMAYSGLGCTPSCTDSLIGQFVNDLKIADRCTLHTAHAS